MYVETLNSDAADNRFYCITIIGIFSGTSSDIKKKCIFEHCKINNINKFPLYIYPQELLIMSKSRSKSVYKWGARSLIRWLYRCMSSFQKVNCT